MTMTDAERRAYRRHENAFHEARQAMWKIRARARRREGIVPPRADGWRRAYVGAGITATCDGEEILLTTKQDWFEAEIYVEPAALAALVTFARRCGL